MCSKTNALGVKINLENTYEILLSNGEVEKKKL